MPNLMRRLLRGLRLLVCVANIPIVAFGYYNLDGSRGLSPQQDFAAAPPGAIRHHGDYIYFVAFAPSAIRMLLFALVVTTVLMVFRFEAADQVEAKR